MFCVSMHPWNERVDPGASEMLSLYQHQALPGIRRLQLGSSHPGFPLGKPHLVIHILVLSFMVL